MDDVLLFLNCGAVAYHEVDSPGDLSFFADDPWCQQNKGWAGDAFIYFLGGSVDNNIECLTPAMRRGVVTFITKRVTARMRAKIWQ